MRHEANRAIPPRRYNRALRPGSRIGATGPDRHAAAQPCRPSARRTSPSSTPKTSGSPTLDGKNPRRLTTDLGVESHPVFSADGQTIAFSAQYDGNTDVYTIPLAGGSADAPDVRTHRPDTVRGFTPDGKGVLFSSNRHVYSQPPSATLHGAALGRHADAVADPVGLRGRLLAGRRVHRLHAGPRRHVAVEALSRRHALADLDLQRQDARGRRDRRSRRTAATTSTRTGSATRSTSAPTAPASTTSSPTTPASKEVKPVTQFTDFPVLDINTDGKKLIFEQAGYLHLLTPGESQPQRLKVGIAIDDAEARPRFAKGSKYVRDVSSLAERARAWRSSSAARSSPSPPRRATRES